MFVDIESFKSVLAVENFLIPYKRGRLAPDKKSYLPKDPITPEVCMEVLKSTNAPRNIKAILSCIAELPLSEQAQFKDVVLATFDNREQPDSITELGEKLAELSNYHSQFMEALEPKDGLFLRSDPHLSRDLRTSEDVFIDVDFNAYPPFENLICLKQKSLVFSDMKKLPKRIEFGAGLSSVKFINCDMSETSLVNLQHLRQAYFEKIPHLPQNFSVDDCLMLTFSECCLKNIDGCQLKNIQMLKLSNVTSIPENLDVSGCLSVDIIGCDLSSVRELKFKDGARVCLLTSSNVPYGVDVSRCSEFIFAAGNLDFTKKLQFQKDAVVSISYASSLPENIDVSRCKQVKLPSNDWSAVKRIIFKDKKQQEKSVAQFPENWSGKVEFMRSSNVINKIIRNFWGR